jgi:chromate transporter
MITPGPVVITVGFIGSWRPWACVAALATFLPCYLFTVIRAPYFKKYGKHPAIKVFVDGVTAAAIGGIAGAVCVLARRQLTDVTSVAIAVVTIGVLLKFKKIPEPFIILVAAIAGLLIKNYL